MPTRPADFFNTETLKPSYGIKILINGKWVTAGDNDGMFAFASKAERDIKRQELSKQKLTQAV